jgi:hypothetical protein
VSGSTCVEHDGDMNPLSGAARRRHWLTSTKWHLDDCFRPRTLMRGWIAFVHAVPVECERVGYGTAWQGCADVTEARGCGRSGRPFATGRHLPHLKTNDPRVARGSCTAGNARCGQYADTPGDAQGCGVLLHDPGTGAALRHHRERRRCRRQLCPHTSRHDIGALTGVRPPPRPCRAVPVHMRRWVVATGKERWSAPNTRRSATHHNSVCV